MEVAAISRPCDPKTVEKMPPCTHHCPSSNDIRGWLTVVAQREKTGISLEEAWTKAWYIEVETNPFPAIMGRVCPHPCETSCNRKDKDGAVAINSVERTIGDWGIEKKLELPKLDAGGPFEEKIAVVGSGPSGMSCAYQLARRGYKVTIFEAFDKQGGMLRWGIPEYRLPRETFGCRVPEDPRFGCGAQAEYARRARTSVLEDLEEGIPGRVRRYRCPPWKVHGDSG